MRFLIALLVSCFCLVSLGSVVANPQRVAYKDGNVVPMQSGKLLCDLNVKSASSDWEKFENYEHRVARAFEKFNGEPVMILRNAANKKHDTAWNLVSKAIPVKPSVKRLLLEIDFRAGVRWNVPNPEKTPFRNCVLWFNKQNKQIKRTDFTYLGFFEGFVLTQVALDVPEGAVACRVQLGVDFPDIHNNQYIVYRSVRVLEAIPGSSKNSFDSRTFKRETGKISWSGDFPAKSYGTLQLAWAPDVNGAPGKWSEFIGPDGTGKSVYKKGSTIQNLPTEARYLRYRFTFHYRKSVPMLKSVSIGSFKDSNWNTYFSVVSPIVVNVTPAVRNFSKPVMAKIIPSTLIDWKSLKFSVDGVDVTKSVIIEGNTVKYVPEKPFADKLHSFSISIADIEGNKTKVKRYFDFVDMPQNNIVTLRDDGMTLIDGKPFFPIGIYSLNKKPWNNNSFDQAMRDIKEAGFNLTHTYFGTAHNYFGEFISAARKYDMKVFIAGPDGANSKNLPRIIDTVRQMRNDPSVLSWYLADDTSSHWGPEELAEMTDAVNAVDPSRPTSQADGVGGYNSFVNSSKIFLPEIYAGLNDKLELDGECVPYVIWKVRDTFKRIELEGNANVSVWTILSYFRGWGINRYASYRELRAMAYAAIIYGSQGLTWYTYSAGDHKQYFGASQIPEKWQIMSKLTKELNQMHDVLCERKAAIQPEITIISGPAADTRNNPSIAGLLKIHNGKYYYLTVNSSADTVKAAFAIPGVKSGRVLFENDRKVTLRDGKLTDTFAPYDVHIYELQ